MNERAVAYLQPQSRAWPVLTGVVPFLGDAYARRPETGQGLNDALHPGLTVILGPDGDSRASAARRSGTGKTQLAAAFATRLWTAGELDLLVWADAGSRDSIISGYASALAGIQVAAQPGRPEASAARFLAWLAGTGRRWLVVLDGLADPADAEGLWPYGPSGQVLVTTRLAGLRPKPATPAAPAQVAIAVPAFSQREALAYMSARLNDDPYQAAGSLDLAIALECLPIGLALAVAYLHDSGQDCRQYRLARERYSRDRTNGVASDPLAPSWMLAVDRARQFAPTELAWPAAKLAAVLGPTWIPGAVLTSTPACAYVTGRRSVTRGDQGNLRAAFGNLQRLGLVTIEPDDEARTVRMPAALQFSIRQVMTATELRQTVAAAADAIYECWPERAARAGQPALPAPSAPPAGPDRPGLEQALRDCAVNLRRCDDLALWDRGCHPLLVRVGQSLDDAQMPETAFGYWRDLTERSAEYFGAGSPLTMELRERLASAATAAGHADEATSLREQLVADIDKVAGQNHPQAITSRASLAVALHAAGRLGDAILMGERVVADSELVLGQAHPQTTESLDELGCAYVEAGRYPEAIGALERCLAVREQTIGLMHSQTSVARYHLADAYRRANQARDAILLFQDALVQMEGAAGAAHPDTIAAREKLAIAYYQAGQTDVAVAELERALADSKRVPGAAPADTLAVRANLAAIYCRGGRLKEAVPLYEGELADLEKIRGPGHPDTLRARWKLAAAWHKAKRLPEAIKLGEATLTDCEQILGPGHWETLTARANLAHAYHSAGLLKRASAQFDRALHDCEQSLGPQDPLTEQVRTLRKRYLAGRQGAAPIIAPPAGLPRCGRGQGIMAGMDLTDSERGIQRLSDMRKRTGAMVDHLASLVSVETPSADLAACAAGAAAVTHLATTLLGEPGERVEVDGRVHLRWRWAPDGGGPCVALIGHYDTVWPSGTLARWPFSADESAGIATGPGCFDMKAGVVQLLHAVACLDDRAGIEILLTADEEIGSPTSRHLVEEAARRASAALILEPSAAESLKVGRKGTGAYQLEVHGRAAHAGLEPEKGANALIELARLVLAVKDLARSEAGTSVTPTLAEAGTARNVVPAAARADVDVRVAEQGEADRVDRAIRALRTTVPGTTLTVSGGLNRPPMSPDSCASLQEKATALAAGLGLAPIEGVVVGGGSDGNFTAAVGCPTLDGLGAVGAGAHAEGEHVIIAAMPERAALLAELVDSVREG